MLVYNLIFMAYDLSLVFMLIMHIASVSCPLPAAEEACGKPFAYRDIVYLYACIGYGYRRYEDAYGHPYVGAERSVGMLRGPVHLYLDHRIVGDVERIGDHAEELAYCGGLLSL